ncbi:MAG TPA: adenosylcobinamide kinase [Lachnospiraceae bacterium]|nr:adenosylcobinamide kinase [Lachnospiraceae bacterium]
MSVHVIIGKQNSGKSLRAEELAVSYGRPLYYIATMKVMDEEGRKRVERHRKQREGKGFITIEHEYDLHAISALWCEPSVRSQATVLLECVANLVGNELFDNPDRPWSRNPLKVEADEFVRTISDDIKYLADQVKNLIIVSSEYDLDEDADEETRLYVSLLNRINEDMGTVLLSSQIHIL